MTASAPSVVATDSKTDADLLAAAGAGDRAALGVLVRRYVDFVYACAVRQLGDRHAAEDVTQAVFLVLARKAARVRAPALSAWLHQTTRYAASNARRAARRRVTHEKNAARPEAAMPTDPTAAEDELAARLTLLDDAIARLAAKDRTAVVERYLKRREVTAVAAALGVTPAAAQKRIERAVDALRGTLCGEAFRRAAARGVRANVGLPETAVVVGLLAAAAPSAATAAPPTLAATIAAAVATPAAASTGAVAVAHGVKQTLLWTQAKAAAVAVVTVAAGATGVAVVHDVVAHRTPATNVAATQPATQPAAAVSEREKGPTFATRATLASGFSIEYLGVSESPANGLPLENRPWYGPGGALLATPLYAQSGAHFLADSGKVAREFAFDTSGRLPAAKNGPDANAATIRSINYETTGDVETVTDWTTDEGRRPFVLSAAVLAPVGKPVDLKFDVAAGKWVPRVVSLPDADTTIVGTGDVKRVMLGRPFGDDEDGLATVWYWPAEFYSRPDVRMVAIDTAGGVHVPRTRPWDYRSPEQRFSEPEMDRIMPRQRFRNTPLRDVVRFIEDQGVLIVMDWDSLAKAKITPDTPVDGTIDGDRLYRWMGHLLLNVKHTLGDPAFEVRGGEVRVSAGDYRRPRPDAYFVPGVPPERLARFEVQTRPFDEWVRFSGLPTELGKPGNVTVTTSDDKPATPPMAVPPALRQPAATSRLQTLADGTTVELVALGDASTGDCWTPDGRPTTVPFGITPQKPDPDWLARVGRLVWAVTVARRPDESEPPNDPRPTKETGTAFSVQGARSSVPVKYRLIEFFVDPKRTAVDLSVGVATKPPKTASIQRGFDGWDPKAAASVDVAGGRMWVWGPSTNAAGEAVFSAWVPPYGKGEVSYLSGVRYDGDDLTNTMWMTSAVPQVRTIQTHESLDAVHRVTIGMTTFDETATFAGVPLRPAAGGGRKGRE